jgi:hypothetical protein
MQYLPSEINGSNSVKESAFILVVWRKIQVVKSSRPDLQRYDNRVWEING